MKPREFHLLVNSDNAADPPSRLLAAGATLSRQQVKQAMHKGAVWLTHARHTRRLRRERVKLEPGDELHLYYNPDVLLEIPLKPRLIADEQDYSVWYKPAGMRSQGSKWGDHTTLTRGVELNLLPQRPVFLVHRLDRFADGLILVAHSKTMACQLASLFERRSVEKRYRVWVHGDFPDTAKGLRLDQPLDDRPAVSHARKVDADSGKNRSLVEVSIETGRKHQIRRHLAAAGYPVVGDRQHGRDTQEDLQLTAVQLAFPHPVSGATKTYRLERSLRPTPTTSRRVAR